MPAPPEPVQAEPKPATEVERLAKLCRVWGYVKYHHPVFLLGQKDWDEELLALIPQVREAETDQEVNALLHQWFVDLGEIDYGTDKPVAFWADAAEEDRLVITDTSWTADAAYLGEELAGDLGQLGEIPNIRRLKGPVSFGTDSTYLVTYPIFIRENGYPDMDYGDARYRLLGLFRAWNVLEYYFPYHDLTGEDWRDCLDGAIPAMLEADSHQSYLLAIGGLLTHIHDNHVSISPHTYSRGPHTAAASGTLYPDSLVVEAEGRLVVSNPGEDSPLKLGDVILRVNGVDIDEAAELLKTVQSCSRDEIFLSVGAEGILAMLSVDQEQVEVAVLRDGKEETILCDLTAELAASGSSRDPWQILEGNIGLINPWPLLRSQHGEMMEALRDTDGLVIDLRQYPWDGMTDPSAYFATEYAPVFIDASPSIAAPGAYVKEVHSAGYRPEDGDLGVYHYDKPVAVLINEHTQSAGEWAAWSIGKGENVVLMGQNTAGALNRIGDVPLPGGWWFTYTAVRAELDDGSQIQRVGITPDIPVARTIQGIKEGRDELMEAAIAYIQEAA